MTALIAVATEDILSEEVGIRLASEAGFTVDQKLRREGSGYLKTRVKAFCEISRRLPVLVIADLDRKVCPPAMIESWFGSLQRPRNLLFRVAATEIESWVLADHLGIGGLLKLRVDKIPRDPDALIDPKATLVALARRAPRSVRDDIVPYKGSVAAQGLNYNRRLVDFVQNSWDPQRAATRSRSLQRARSAIRGLVTA